MCCSSKREDSPVTDYSLEPCFAVYYCGVTLTDDSTRCTDYTVSPEIIEQSGQHSKSVTEVPLEVIQSL